jgi:hypothetical protein
MENIVKDILALAPANQLTIDGTTYTDKPVYRLPAPPAKPNTEMSPDPVATLSTLNGLISILRAEGGELAMQNGNIFILVKSATEIVVFTTFRPRDFELETGKILPYGKRQNLYGVKFAPPQIKLNANLTYEQAIIQLNSLFEKTDERDELIKAISSIDRTDSGGIEDNGISQTVTAKSGVALKNKTTIKPIWKLKPYRSFVEAPLAEVSLLLRVNEHFEVGLHECDGGKWELDAKENIKRFIEDKIFDFPKELSAHIIVIS